MSLACSILFVVVFVYAVITSKARVKTVLYTLGAVVVAGLLCVALTWVRSFTQDQLGAIGIIAMSVAGGVVALVHSFNSRKLPA